VHRSRQITTPTPHHSVFYRPDGLPVTQPTASKHWSLSGNPKYFPKCQIPYIAFSVGWAAARASAWVAGMVICLEQDADMHMAQMPLTVCCFSKIQIGFNFLLQAHLGSPGKRAVKRVCVCVCVRYHILCFLTTLHQNSDIILNDTVQQSARLFPIQCTKTLTKKKNYQQIGLFWGQKMQDGIVKWEKWRDV